MANISDILSRTLNLDIIVSTLDRQINRALRLERMEVIILEEGKPFWQKYQTGEKKEALKKIISYFKKEKKKECCRFGGNKEKKSGKYCVQRKIPFS